MPEALKAHLARPAHGGYPSAVRITEIAPAAEPWDASQIKQPDWSHVEAAFIEGAREARANPDADEGMFRRAADGYTKRVFEEVDPVSEAALRTAAWATVTYADPTCREAQMVVIERDASGKPTVWCDPEIADLIRALNSGGVPTEASCSGHGEKPGWIALKDGRQLAIVPDLESFKRLIGEAGAALTDEQVEPLFREAKAMPVTGEKDEWFWFAWGVEMGERAHGIRPAGAKEGRDAKA